jgi:hypothetical protein
LAGLAALPGGCARPDLAGCGPALDRAGLWVVDRGWHTEIALPARAVSGPLSALLAGFPGVATLLFGFGQRDFVLAPRGDLGTWLAAPFPGPAAIEVTALRALPPGAVAAPLTALPLPPDGAAALCGFLWDSLAEAGAAVPRPIAQSAFGSQFYAARQGYSLAYTCNRWVAEGLAQAGLPVRAERVVLASQLLDHLAALPAACRA